MSSIFVQIMTNLRAGTGLYNLCLVYNSKFLQIRWITVKFLEPEKSKSGLDNFTLHSVTHNFTTSILFLIMLSILFLLWSLHIMKHLHVMAIHTPDI
jgi:hypothetical protein